MGLDPGRHADSGPKWMLSLVVSLITRSTAAWFVRRWATLNMDHPLIALSTI